MTNITAKLPAEFSPNGRNYSDEKEMTAAYIVIGIGSSRSDVKEVATARFHMGRSKTASRVYCSLWVHGRCSGHGWAGGYGYHKPSAALDSAIRSAGITLEGDEISGRGESAMLDALHAIGIAAGFDTVRVFCA